MKFAFEMHRDEILAAMERPEILTQVTQLLVEGNKRVHERETMMISALAFFGVCPSNAK